MNELLVSLAAGLLWGLPFVLLVVGLGPLRGVSTGRAVLIAYPLFFALQVVLPKAAGWAGVLNTPFMRGAFVALALAGVAYVVRRRASYVPPTAIDVGEPNPHDADDMLVRRLALGASASALLVLAGFALVSPVHVWDVLAYHMPMVASYVQNASLEPWPTQELRQILRVNGGEMQMLNLALLSASDAWVELPNLLGLAVFLVATYELARRCLPHRYQAYVAVALVLTAPQILVGAATAKNDLMFSAALLCAFHWVVEAGRLDEGTGVYPALALAALSGALATATKVLGLNVLGATGVVLLVLLARRRLVWRHVAFFSVVAVGASGLLVGDVFWRNLNQSALPVGLAPGELHISVGLGNLTEAARYYLGDLAFLRLITPGPVEHDFLHYGYLFPLLLALGAVGAFRGIRGRHLERAGLAVAGAAFFLSVIAVRTPIRWDQRFMIWMVPVAGILALSVFDRRPLRGFVAVVGLAVGLAVANLGALVTLESDRLFYRSARHLIDRASLARYVDVANVAYRHRSDGFEILDAHADPEDGVLYAGTDDSWMYLAWGPRFTRRVSGVSDADQAAASVRSGRYRFVVMEPSLVPAIATAMLVAIESADYRVLADADGRVIFEQNRRHPSGPR